MDEIRGLRSANSKLQSDKKTLEKRVSDLEEEIKTRCRNYMTIIEKLKRGEGVQVNHVIERSPTKSLDNERTAALSKKPLSLGTLFAVKVQGTKAIPANGNHYPFSEQRTPTRNPRRLALVDVLSVMLQGLPKQQSDFQLQTDFGQGESNRGDQFREKAQPVVEDNFTQTNNDVSVDPAASTTPLSSSGQVKEEESHHDALPQTWDVARQWSIPLIKDQTYKLEKSVSEQDSAKAGEHKLKEQIQSLRKEVAGLIKYKALCSQLTNYKPPSIDQLKRQFQKRMSNPSSKLGQAASALQTHVNSLLRKLQYYETIIYGVEGCPERVKAKYNEKPLEKLLEDLFKQISAEDSQKRDTLEREERYEHDLKALQQEIETTIQQRDELLAENTKISSLEGSSVAQYLPGATPSSNQTAVDESTPIKRLLKEPPMMATASTNTECEAAQSGSAQTSDHSSKKSSDSKKLKIEMARHHMIMFNKDEGCRECSRTKLLMNERIDEIMNSRSRELAELFNQHRQESMAKDEQILKLTEELEDYKNRKTELLAHTGQGQDLGSSPINRVGFEYQELPFEESQFLKRSFLKTTRMKKTVSTNKVLTKSLNKQEIRRHLAIRLNEVNERIEQLRSEHREQDEETETLEHLRKKLNRMYRKYNDEVARESDRSSESSQCQESSTEVIEVRLETPNSLTENLRLVTSRRYFPGQEPDQASHFDFRKKDVAPQC